MTSIASIYQQSTEDASELSIINHVVTASDEYMNWHSQEGEQGKTMVIIKNL